MLEICGNYSDMCNVFYIKAVQYIVIVSCLSAAMFSIVLSVATSKSVHLDTTIGIEKKLIIVKCFHYISLSLFVFVH